MPRRRPSFICTWRGPCARSSCASWRAATASRFRGNDPGLFDTTLNDEVAMLATSFGLDLPAIDEILLNSVRQSFLPAAQKEGLEAAYRAELHTLKLVHLGS